MSIMIDSYKAKKIYMCLRLHKNIFILFSFHMGKMGKQDGQPGKSYKYA